MSNDSKELNRPTIAILIPVYNSRLFLRRALDSIQAQTYRNFVCLLSDDCSTDDSLAICEEYQKADSRFQSLKTSRNLGWIGNVNHLLEQVDTDFFMLMSHDDVLLSTYLECLLDSLLAEPGAIVAFSDMEYIYEDGSKNIQAFNVNERATSVRKRCSHLLRKVRSWWVPYRGLVRTQLVANQVRLRKNLAGEVHADRAWILDLAMRGTFIRYPQILYVKYRYTDSVSRLWSHNRWETVASLLSCMRAVATGPLSLWDKLVLMAILASKMGRALVVRHASKTKN